MSQPVQPVIRLTSVGASDEFMHIGLDFQGKEAGATVPITIGVPPQQAGAFVLAALQAHGMLADKLAAKMGGEANVMAMLPPVAPRVAGIITGEGQRDDGTWEFSLGLKTQHGATLTFGLTPELAEGLADKLAAFLSNPPNGNPAH